MARYLQIYVEQEPFDGGVDVGGRQTVKFNIMVDKVASDTFLEEIATLLEAANVGTRTGARRNMFLSTAAVIPQGEGPFLSIIETGGTSPLRTHNQGAIYRRPSAQIVARATDYQTARVMARNAHTALVNIVNTVVTPT